MSIVFIFMHAFSHTHKQFSGRKHNIHNRQERLGNDLLAYILLVAIGSSIDIFHANPSLLQGGSFYDTFIESKFSCFSRQGGHST